MRHFWRKPKEVRTKQRVIFIVRELDPLWFLDQHSKDECKISRSAEDHLIYMTNNIGLQVPISNVYLVNLGTETAEMTTGAIKRKLDGYELKVLRNNCFPELKRSSLKNWINEVTELLSDWDSGSLIAVIDRSTFDSWVDKTDLIGEETDDTCMLVSHGPTKIMIAA